MRAAFIALLVLVSPCVMARASGACVVPRSVSASVKARSTLRCAPASRLRAQARGVQASGAPSIEIRTCRRGDSAIRSCTSARRRRAASKGTLASADRATPSARSSLGASPRSARRSKRGVEVTTQQRETCGISLLRPSTRSASSSCDTSVRAPFSPHLPRRSNARPGVHVAPAHAGRRVRRLIDARATRAQSMPPCGDTITSLGLRDQTAMRSRELHEVPDVRHRVGAV